MVLMFLENAKAEFVRQVCVYAAGTYLKAMQPLKEFQKLI